MQRTDRRHSVAGSPSKLPRKNSPKKANARTVLAFRMKGILGFGRADSPLPLPKLRPGGGGLSPIITRMRAAIKRSDSLPTMPSSYTNTHIDAPGGGGEDDAKKLSEYGQFHAELCARVANWSPDGLEKASGVGSSHIASEDGSESMVEVYCVGNSDDCKSSSVSSSLAEELVSDETESLLCFAPLFYGEEEEKTDSDVEEREFVSITRPDDENTGFVAGMPTSPCVRVGEVSYSPIHAAVYETKGLMTRGNEDCDADLSFDLMIHKDDHEIEEHEPLAMERHTDQVDTYVSHEMEMVIDVDGTANCDGSGVSGLFFSRSSDELSIATPLSSASAAECDKWEPSDNESNREGWTEDGGSTCSIPEPRSIPLSIGEPILSYSDAMEFDESQESTALARGRIDLTLGYIDSALASVVVLNNHTRHLQQLQEANVGPRRDEYEDSSDNTWVEAEFDPISDASSTLVSSFDPSTSSEDDEDEAFTELSSTTRPIGRTQHNAVLDEIVEHAENPMPFPFRPRYVAPTVRPFRFADMIDDEQQLTISTTSLDAGGCTEDWRSLEESSLITHSNESVNEKDGDSTMTQDEFTPSTPESGDEETPTIPTQSTRPIGTNVSIGLAVGLSVAALLGACGIISLPRRVDSTLHFTDADCRKVLRDLGWITNRRTLTNDEGFSALNGAVWNSSNLITSPCDVVQATYLPEEIAAYEHKMHQIYDEMEAESHDSRDGLCVGASGVEGKFIFCLAFTLLAWALLQYDSLA